jgi:hypothetical protein
MNLDPLGSAMVPMPWHCPCKIGVEPADGYAGVGLLARLRQGS